MSKDKHLHRDNKTRWNSYAIAIQTALLPQVRQAINRWFIEYSTKQEEWEVFTEDDWVMLEKVYFEAEVEL